MLSTKKFLSNVSGRLQFYNACLV